MSPAESIPRTGHMEVHSGVDEVKAAKSKIGIRLTVASYGQRTLRALSEGCYPYLEWNRGLLRL